MIIRELLEVCSEWITLHDDSTNISIYGRGNVLLEELPDTTLDCVVNDLRIDRENSTLHLNYEKYRKELEDEQTE